MKHRTKILKIAEFLIANNLDKEAAQILALLQKKSQSKASSLEQWNAVLEELDAPYDPTFKVFMAHLKSSLARLKKSAEALQGADPEVLKKTLKLISSGNIGRFLKSSSEQHITKEASWTDLTKLFAKQGLHYGIPLVSFIFALASLYYCAVEYSKLMSELPEANLNWYDALMPNKILVAVNQNKHDPDILKKLTKATKTSEVFITEFISFLANSIDGIKDLVFLVAEFGTGGLVVGLDIGISFFIMGVEFGLSSERSSSYERVLKNIRDIASRKVSDLKINQFEIEPQEKSEDLQELERQVLRLAS